MRVLVTRAQDDAERTGERLAASGHRPILAPVTEVVPVPSEAPAGAFDATLATSANAFTGLLGRPSSSPERPLFAVGERTAAAAIDAGFAEVRACVGEATDLAALVLSILKPPARVLYLAGRNRKPTLESALLGAGLSVAVQETYEARRLDAWDPDVVDQLRTGRVDAVLHFSRRSATLALDLARRQRVVFPFLRLRHYCLSEDVAAPLRAADAGSVEVAMRPDVASLLALLSRPEGMIS